MEIIGAGFGRTGTTSTVRALNDLGYKCYDMSEVIRLDQIQLWINAFKGDKGPLLEQIEKGGYTATLDFPGIAVFDDLLKRNPGCKVLLNVRDSPQQWVKSFRATIWKVMQVSRYQDILFYCGPPFNISNTSFAVLLHDGIFGEIIRKCNTIRKTPITAAFRDLTDTDLAEMYTDWIEYVKQNVPADKLLIFNVKDGIKPLAQFCNKPIPDWEMPRTNDAATFESRTQLVTGKVLAVTAWVGVALTLIGTFCFMRGDNANFIILIGFLLLYVPYIYAKSAQAKRDMEDGIKTD